MSNLEQPPKRPSVLRFTRTMSGPLRQTYPVGEEQAPDEFTSLLEEADRRRQAKASGKDS